MLHLCAIALDRPRVSDLVARYIERMFDRDDQR